MPEHFHFAVAWDWEFDRNFVSMLEAEIHARHLLFYSISHHNVNETQHRFQKGELTFGVFMDRVGDTDEKFHPLIRAVRRTSIPFLNLPEAVQRASDKATMHLEFLSAGIDVPFTIIISPYTTRKEVGLSLSDLAKLGRPFIIKPANTTGGGMGVILGAETLKEVIESRQHHKNDKYLLQENIAPVLLDQRKGWFRVFSVFDHVIPCWWDHETHLYAPVTRNEMEALALEPLVTIMHRIAGVCRLDFFSSEIAVTGSRRFVVVDYVNEICDMRLQSRHPDGVPDPVVVEVCSHLAAGVKRMVA